MKILWLKLEIDIFDNAKIKKIRRMNGGNELFVLWVGLLTLGMKCKRYGVLEISDGIPYAEDDIAAEYSMTPEAVKNGLDLFESMKMIQRSEGNTIEIINFARYQNLERIEQVRELAKLRQQKRRQKLLEYHEEKKTGINNALNKDNKAEDRAEEEEEEGARDKRERNAPVTRDKKQSEIIEEYKRLYGEDIKLAAEECILLNKYAKDTPHWKDMLITYFSFEWAKEKYDWSIYAFLKPQAQRHIQKEMQKVKYNSDKISLQSKLAELKIKKDNAKSEIEWKPIEDEYQSVRHRLIKMGEKV